MSFQSVKHFLRIVWIFVGSALSIVLLLFGYFNLPGPAPRTDVVLGITFSNRYAEALGLDWRETYIALLDEVKVRKIRIPVYWDLVEKVPGQYDFADVDWQLAEAKKRNAEVILSLGQRVPRWPECHIPEWANASDDLRKQALFKMLGESVKRYQNHSEIVKWQVENEPFLVFFGICPKFDPNQLEEEVAFVRTLDSTRPVMLTDSGELSLWFRAASRGDEFGTTMYRKIYKPGVGYVTYPLGPNFFRFKEQLTRLLTKQEHFSVIELQAEPWANGWVADAPIEEQFKTMDAKQLQEVVTYARRVGFSEIYLWGGEWWYWMKEKKGHPEVWNTAKELFGASEVAGK
jgi:hypothetical protein